MTEYELNQLLTIGRKAANYQYSLGRKEVGDLLLKLTSDLALDIIDNNGLNKPVICGNCEKQVKQPEDRDYTREYGVCLGCDQLYGEIAEERTNELLN